MSSTVYSCLYFFIITMTIASGLNVYTQGYLSIRWRRWMTEHYLGLWLANRNYHTMELHNTLDNPDQRISEDLEKLPELFLPVFFAIFKFLLGIFSYGYILFNLSAKFPITIINMAWNYSGILLLRIFAVCNAIHPDHRMGQ